LEQVLNFNQVLVPTLLAWLCCQLSKPLFSWIFQGRFELARIFDPGGMPSSHTAAVVAVTTIVGLVEGVASTLFAVSMVFSAIVIYDATGVRRSAGRHAEAINQIFRELVSGKLVRADILRHELEEVLGHNWLEVVVGAVIGGALSVIFFALLYPAG